MGHSNIWNSHPKTYGPGSRTCPRDAFSLQVTTWQYASLNVHFIGEKNIPLNSTQLILYPRADYLWWFLLLILLSEPLEVNVVLFFEGETPCFGNPHGIIRKYGLMCCRQCFRSNAKEIGFIKYR
ncbi:uncharacterized protein LOC125220598 [Salvia hispanica]|uniref:uncharacterized protein LOC125220598 n=1 Tax=Salvia hispanica TaxID=49212 RepID=UPI0020098DFD|nr:uncharacterized protein LOC125220598 [Salvia hispanica]